MKILTVDIGTGTQDILLYDSNLAIENGYKLILPSPTLQIHRQIQAATRQKEALLLTGHMMGGGPSAWAAEAHARAGLPIYATPDAARTFNDNLDKVRAMGIQIIAEEEARRLPKTIQRLEMTDFDFPLLAETFSRFGLTLRDLAAVAVAVFDHGDTPPGISNRQSRFDYLDERLRARNTLTSFAYSTAEIPSSMTRLQAVATAARTVDAPLIVMDSAPAAILGATFDPYVAARPQKLVANLGNFHCLAFRLGEHGVEGLFEHHTGEIDLPRLTTLLRRLAAGTLTHAEIFNDMGHGALLYDQTPLELGRGDWDVAVTGPRRTLMNAPASGDFLAPCFATPFGDMMLSGNIGLLAAVADQLPGLGEHIRPSLAGHAPQSAPWDLAA